MSSDYGVLSNIVTTAGSLVSATTALTLGWRGRASWEPSEQDISKGPQKVASLISAVSVALVWVYLRQPEQIDWTSKVTIFGAIFTASFLLLYGFVSATQTYFREIGDSSSDTKRENVIGGFSLVPEARDFIRDHKTVTLQEYFRIVSYDFDRVWKRSSRALAKQLFVLVYMGLTVSGTISIASASMLVGASIIAGKSDQEVKKEVHDLLAGIEDQPSSEARRMITILEGEVAKLNTAEIKEVAIKELVAVVFKNAESPTAKVREIRTMVLESIMRLRGKDLAGLFIGRELDGLDLVQMDFSNANLRAVSFRDAFLIQSNFEGANLDGASFSGAFIRNVKFRKASIRNTDFTDADWFNASGLDSAQLALSKIETLMACPVNVDSLQAYLHDSYEVPFSAWPTSVQDELFQTWRQYLVPGGLRDVVARWNH